MKTRVLTGAVIIAAVVAAASAVSAAAGFTLRVNAGDSSQYTDKAGNVWSPEKSYTKGSGYGFVGGDSVDRGEIAIAHTSDPRIYRTEHYSMDAFVAEVPDGNYTVRLHFAETYEGISSDGPRVFDVTIQSTPVLSDFDVQKTAGAVETAIVKEFKGIAVTDGIIRIGFVPKQQNPEINGIEIIAQ